MTRGPETYQLALNFPHKPSFHEGDFLVSSANQPTFSALIGTPHRGMTYLYGDQGAGKSHLAHIWASRHSAPVIDALTLKETPFLIDSLPEALAVENIDQLVNEKALFHLINLVKEQKSNLLVTARLPARHLPFKLKDLNSRLGAMPAFKLEPLPDNQLGTLMMKLLSDRQISLNANLIDAILARLDRRVESLIGFVSAIDHTSLTEKKPPGKGLIMRLLNNQEPLWHNQSDQGELFNL